MKTRRKSQQNEENDVENGVTFFDKEHAIERTKHTKKVPKTSKKQQTARLNKQDTKPTPKVPNKKEPQTTQKDLTEKKASKKEAKVKEARKRKGENPKSQEVLKKKTKKGDNDQVPVTIVDSSR